MIQHNYRVSVVGPSGLRYNGIIRAANTDGATRVAELQVGAPLRFANIRRVRSLSEPGSIAHQAAAASQSIEAARHAAGSRAPIIKIDRLSPKSALAPLSDYDTACGRIDDEVAEKEDRHTAQARRRALLWQAGSALIGAAMWAGLWFAIGLMSSGS